MDIALKDEKATTVFAQQLASVLQAGDVVMLYGDLGAGKTFLARALINALSKTPQEVPSPTFTLVQCYDTKNMEIWHFDLYRLEHADEVVELGWDEALGSALLLIEWPDRLGHLRPEDRLEINLKINPDYTGQRKLAITAHGAYTQRKELLLQGWEAPL